MPVMTTPTPPPTLKSTDGPKKPTALVISGTAVGVDFKNYMGLNSTHLGGVDQIEIEHLSNAAIIAVDAKLLSLHKFVEKFGLRQPTHMQYDGPVFANMIANGSMDAINPNFKNIPLMVIGTPQAPTGFNYISVPNGGFSHMGGQFAVLNEEQVNLARDSIKVYLDDPSKGRPHSLTELRMFAAQVDKQRGGQGEGVL